MRGLDGRVYGWVGKEEVWRELGDRKVDSISSSLNNRLYLISNNDKVLQQSTTPTIKKCLKKQPNPKILKSANTKLQRKLRKEKQ